MTTPLNLVADDVCITYRSYLDPQVDLRDRLKGGRAARRRHVNVDAVRGVSFELRAGESIGLIGHNGAGKSSLLLGLAGLLPLKQGAVLARSRRDSWASPSNPVPRPSQHRDWRLAMGMPKHEIDRRMDGLVEFAGLEDAIDLPLKAYSSGMRARLSFTVATVEAPEVLLVDEALAVGDADFRVKATQRIEEIRQAAGSVIVVSHNMAEVERMCDRALWLDHGTVVRDGTARRLIRLYGTTRSNPELMASLLDDESGPLGPLRPMDLRALRETRFVASQVEPWEMLGRAEIGGFPMSVPSPSVLDTSAVSSARAVALGAVHDVTDRPPHVVEGALLRDWLFEPESGAVLAEWPSASEPGQSIVLQRPSRRSSPASTQLAQRRRRLVPRPQIRESIRDRQPLWLEPMAHDPCTVDRRRVASAPRIDRRPAGGSTAARPAAVGLAARRSRCAGGRPWADIDLDVPGGELVRFMALLRGAQPGGRGDLARYRAGQCHGSPRARCSMVSPCSGPADLRPSANGTGRSSASWCNDRATDAGFEIVFGLSFEETVRPRCCRGRRGPDGTLAGTLLPEGSMVIELQPETFALTTGRAVSSLVGRTPDPGVPCSGRWRIDATARGLRRHRGSG